MDEMLVQELAAAFQQERVIVPRVEEFDDLRVAAGRRRCT